MQAARARQDQNRSEIRVALCAVVSVLVVSLAGALGAGANGTATAAAVPNLAAAYGFDAGSGTTLRDDSGNANSGTISGPTWTASGKHGAALTFDGVNDWVSVPASASLNCSSAMTLEARVKPTALGSSWRTAIFKEQSGFPQPTKTASPAHSEPPQTPAPTSTAKHKRPPATARHAPA